MVTEVEKPPTLETLRQQRADLLRIAQRAASITNQVAYGEPRGTPPDDFEILEAPDILNRTRVELRRLDIEILKAERVAAAAAETARAEALTEGKRIVETELPGLIREQRRVQERWRALWAKLEACDHRAGGMPQFGPAGWPGVMGAGGAFDGFVAYISKGYHLELD